MRSTCERPKGRVAVVTGATREIGKGIALELGRAGAVMYLTGSTLEMGGSRWPGTITGTADEVTCQKQPTYHTFKFRPHKNPVVVLGEKPTGAFVLSLRRWILRLVGRPSVLRT